MPKKNEPKVAKSFWDIRVVDAQSEDTEAIGEAIVRQ
jgi:hypothetical protein